MRNIVMLGYNDAQILDITGPLEVFSRTSRLLSKRRFTVKPAYEIHLLSPNGGPITTSSGLQIMSRPINRFRKPINTLLITGGRGYQQARLQRKIRTWIKQRARQVERLGSICTGAMILADCGLLDGQSATTHWAYCDELTDAQRKIKVNHDAIYVRSGNIYTSAGVTAGIDMALAMVEDDWGQQIALAVARQLVLFLKRPGGQAQFSNALASQQAQDSRFADLMLWIREHPAADLRVRSLAGRANMSERNFARQFKSIYGMTPAHFVEAVRIDRAREYLQNSELTLKAIASRCGFNSLDSLRRAFKRRIGSSPSQYRGRFQCD